MSQSSKIFIRNRALGYVSNHIPCVTRFLKSRKEHLVVTSVGRSLHSYGLKKLELLAVSDLTEDEITCLVSEGNALYTACGNKIHSWKRGTKIDQTFIGHEKPVFLLFPFGPHLIAIDEGNLLKVWDKRSEEVFLELVFDEDTFKISAINHPSTYLNKILLGSEQGRMQLWNLKTSKLIYTFDGWSAGITVLEQAPAVDVTAVGLSDGRIILHNLKYDETIVEFVQDWGRVTSIAFRTDGQAIMATGSPVGHIVLWNLEERKVAGQILDAHDKTVASLRCFPCEPLMVSSSPDNSIKVWIFDQPDLGGRLLKLREGHVEQPTCVRFHGANGYTILSSGTDSSLRVFNAANESGNRSMGKASYNRKTSKKKKEYSELLRMPPIVDFTTETTREKEWDNIAALHLGIPVVTTWSFEKKRMGDLKLLPERLSNETRATLNVVASSICLTNCGNFVVIGYSSGHTDRFNVQSGIHRCGYGQPSAHKGSVRGVIVDPLNQVVITGCGQGLVKFWSFKPKMYTSVCPKPMSRMTVHDGVSFFRMHKENSLIGVILEDFTVSVIDFETRKVVRKFSGHSGQITDAVFSPDARWLVTSSMDSTIRTWDLPTGVLVDWIKLDSACTSLSMSPTGQYLATIHVNNLGVYLWTNKTLLAHVSLKPIKDEEEATLMSLPSSTGVEGVINLEEEDEIEDSEEGKSVEQIGDMVTLSLLPSSRWLHLLDIDIIKKRNKPKEALRAPEAAPFFLPTIPAMDIQFDFSSIKPTDDGVKTIRLDKLENYTAFGKLLLGSLESDDFSLAVDKLKSMGPSAIDLEVNSLSLEARGSRKLLLQYMKMVNYMFSTNRDFELAQAYLSLFLKVHGKDIAAIPELHKYLDTLQENQDKAWQTLRDNLFYCLTVSDALKK